MAGRGRAAVAVVVPVERDEAERDLLEAEEVGEAEGAGEVSLEQLEELEGVSEAEDGSQDEQAALEELVDEPDVDTEDREVELDELLALRFTPEADEDLDEGDGAGDAGPTIDLRPVPPAAADEFVCRSCFLIKHRRQMSDPTGRLCRDCAATG